MVEIVSGILFLFLTSGGIAAHKSKVKNAPRAFGMTEREIRQLALFSPAYVPLLKRKYRR